MTSVPAKPAVTVRGVSKSFGSGTTRIEVLKHIDLDARTGEILMLVGPSGCGKTTLLSVIAGALRVDAGEIEVFGNPVHKLSDRALTRFRKRHIGFIFQQFSLIPTLSAAENVSIPLQILRQPRPLARAREALEAVGLGDRASARPGKLSGGQQQRVAIARALVHDPPLVICDEPTASLDAQSGEVVMGLLRQVARASDRAVLIVTHDNRILSYADAIARMDDGCIVELERRPPGVRAHFEHEFPVPEP